ncbi:L,D-transpeptidase [Nocardioides sp. SYSU D00038]|uniref:L,D-transpeptidase n=1 Tax=Nocardioides sp. SYSU D00038 TaxID=2812554 RepID=UPI0019678009|nr:L,D-transpeptidase [Nocardioides sp. SYSU D00038]
MSRHRAEPRHRAKPVVGKRRAAVRRRPRYGQVALAGVPVVLTAAVLAGGLDLGSADGPTPAAAAGNGGGTVDRSSPLQASFRAAGAAQSPRRVAPAPVLERAPDPATLPADSGQGYRVVFSESRQRVWLVDSDDQVVRTYLVSGSLYDNLDPGTYEVYSRSEEAVGIDDSGTMRYFVRFAHGPNAAIGFHDIPEDDGEPLQTVAQLGTPQSHGCIRQKSEDAIALWEFAPLGTTVVVTE